MKHEKICGSTSDLAELIVEYDKKGKPKLLDIKGVPKDTIKNRVRAAWYDWFIMLLMYWGTTVIIIFVTGLFIEKAYDFESNELLTLFDKLISGKHLLLSFIGVLLISVVLSLCHINEKFDKKWKKYFVLKTGNGTRNKATFTKFASKEFIIYNTDNVIVEFEATGDVSKQLEKVWIREDSAKSLYENQADVKRLRWKEKRKEPIWNVHFFFSKLPKSGKLYVEWI